MGNKIYFISDLHLGIPSHKSSLEREKLFVEWLDEISTDVEEIYLLGDIFDFWFEYKTVVPKGFVRLFGKLAELTDAGVKIFLFKGNHDIWAFNYFKKELGVEICRKPEIKTFNNKRFYLAHGDGLGDGDIGYKFLNFIFELRINQWLFKWIHPDIGTRLGLYFSRRSRLANIVKKGKIETSNNVEKERLFVYSKNLVEKGIDVDYFVFGHRHIPLNKKINDKTSCVILGDWLTHFSYAVFDGEKMELKYYSSKKL
ncbi:MAG: UDP-2,3-diacylglucosamine diphosphatase [Bacteroidales bacterium]|nr:UDP-2,3-diacylglucosamine diphosphatase [Bacteroidales bacterium]